MLNKKLEKVIIYVNNLEIITYFEEYKIVKARNNKYRNFIKEFM